MKRYSALRPLYMSFYSRDLYRDVAGNWKTSTAIFSLFLLVALCWLPMSVKFHLRVADFVRNSAPEIVEQFPEVTIADGQVSIDKPMPYVITSNGKPWMIFDTTGQTSLDKYGSIILLAKDRILFKMGSNGPAVLRIPSSRNIKMTREKLEHTLGLLGRWLGLVWYMVIVARAFIYRAAQVLILALVGMLFVKALNAGLGYTALMRLAAVSLMPVIIIEALLYMADIKIPGSLFVQFIIALGYLYFGVKANVAREASS